MSSLRRKRVGSKYGKHLVYDRDSVESTGAKLLNNIAQATAENYATIQPELYFATSGWCDWAYIDRNTFDVFGGEDQKREAPITTPRFSDLGGDDGRVTVPVLLQSFPFSQLPATEEEFKRALEARMREDQWYRGYYILDKLSSM
jgi:hypothetical protein